MQRVGGSVCFLRFTFSGLGPGSGADALYVDRSTGGRLLFFELAPSLLRVTRLFVGSEQRKD